VCYYSLPMPKRVSNFILAFFLLFGTVLCSLPSAGAWYCEGKQCGISLWGCCCTTPIPFQDGKCRTPASVATETDRSAICASGCSCAMVITDNPDCDHAPPPAIAAFDPIIFVAILPAPVEGYTPPVLTDMRVRQIEARGPPARQNHRSNASLRAPPAA
jgi:hypothetical protein